MNPSSVLASRNRQILKPNVMRIIDISHRKTDSEHTSLSAGAQCACCQVSINPTYSQQSSDIINRQPRRARQSFTYKAIAPEQIRPQTVSR
jgi:hypothetical protein